MKLAVIVLILLGCLAAVAAAILVNIIPQMGKVEEVEVLVAAEDLPPLLEIGTSHIKKIQVAKTSVADKQGYLLEPVQAVGRILAKTVSEGELLTTSCFLSEKEAEQFSLEIPKGMTACTVSLPSTSVINTLLYPHCRVDIYGIFNLRNRSEGDARAREILQAIEVLAIGYRHEHSERARADDQMGRSSTVRVTFALAPDQVKALQLARNQGDIHITLRNPRDLEIRKPSELYIAGGAFVGNLHGAAHASSQDDDISRTEDGKHGQALSWLVELIQGSSRTMVPLKKQESNLTIALEAEL